MNPKKRTWSREVAVLLLVCLMYLGYTGQTEELSIVVWPFITFALAAFGFKQPPVEGFFSKERMEL
jgi:hypothetical protein